MSKFGKTIITFAAAMFAAFSLTACQGGSSKTSIDVSSLADDLNAKTISITKTYQVVKGQTVVGPPKTEKGRRIVQMPDTLAAEMRDYYEMCFDKGARAFPVSKSALTRAMKKGCQLSGVKKIRIHDLRHSHISLLISLGFTPVDIGKRVGHESITITLRYAHMFPSAQIGMANDLNKLMGDDDHVG